MTALPEAVFARFPPDLETSKDGAVDKLLPFSPTGGEPEGQVFPSCFRVEHLLWAGLRVGLFGTCDTTSPVEAEKVLMPPTDFCFPAGKMTTWYFSMAVSKFYQVDTHLLT